MKKITLFAAVVSSAILFSACGPLAGTSGAGVGTARPATSASSSLGSASGIGDLIGTVLGAFLGTTNTQSIVGTWIYQKPAIQFESSNLLAKAGGAVASNSVSAKLASYYEMVGIKPGVAKCVFNSNKTCTIALGPQNITGTYELNASAGTLTVTSSLGIKLFTAYVSVSGNQLSLTLDASKLLSAFQAVGSMSSNTTLSTISTLSKSYSGMKTGFLFTK